MRFGTTGNYKWSAPLLIAVCVSAVGCKSGWKMPGASMFNWGRQPSAETLAGNLTTPQLPESPASKYSPTAVASAAAGTKTSAPAGASASATSPMTSPYSTVSTPINSAANANGYQIGPYSTGANPYSGTAGASNQSTGTPTTGTPYTGYSGTSTTGTQAGKSTNPYGGTSYSGATGIGGYGQSSAYSATGLASTPGINPGFATPSPYSTVSPGGLPSAGAGAVAGSNHLPSAFPGTAYSPPASAPSSTPGFSMPNLATSGSISSMPNHIPQSVSVGGGPTGAATTTVSYPMNGSLNPSLPTLPASTQALGSTLGASQASAANGLPTVPSSSAAPAQNASPYSGATTVSTSGYRPGTIGRSTTYNFGSSPSNGPTTSTPTSTAPSQTASQPSSATYPQSYGLPGGSGLNYGTATQLPPNFPSSGVPGMATPTQPGVIYR